MTPSPLLAALRAHRAGRPPPAAGEGTRLTFLACGGCGRREARPLDELASYAAAADCPRCSP